MKKFYQYLKDKGQNERTATEHVKNIERFYKWSEQSGRTSIDGMTYTELLEYVQYLKEKNVQAQTINIRLNGIRHYYEFLKTEGVCDTNPAKRLHIKGAIKRVVVNPLTYSELEKLYHDYAAYADKKNVFSHVHRRSIEKNKVMLSLMIWQGLHSGELKKLRVEHIKLTRGVLDTPGAARSNGRTLSLVPVQMLLLNNYLHSLPKEQQTLFVGDVSQQVFCLMKELTGINPQVKNVAHIRASVVLHWMKVYDKRQVQYMAGHKHISSTEKYELQQLDTLTDQLQRYHPFA